MSVHLSKLEVAEQYVKICTDDKPDKTERFKQILSKDCEVTNFTNLQFQGHEKGRDRVVEIFDEKVFQISSNIVLNYYECSSYHEGIKVKLSVNENKTMDGAEKRYHFEDKTGLFFEKEEDEWKISSINMVVKRKLVGINI
jgi:hypothetical protein